MKSAKRGEKELDAVAFLKYIKEKAALLDLPEDFPSVRSMWGFQGEKAKRNLSDGGPRTRDGGVG